MKRPLKHHAGALAPLLLFVIFTACILSVLLTGADVLQTISQRDQESFRQRTCVQYLTTRIRQSDAVSRVFVGDFDSEPSLSMPSSLVSTEAAQPLTGNTLFLVEELGGRAYYTRIYCCNGSLYELFSPAGVEFIPTDGQTILDVQDLHFTLQERLLTIHITYKHRTTETIQLSLRSHMEVPDER